MLTKKYFRLIAECIRNYPFTDPQDKIGFAHRFADDVLAESNPNFKKETFIDACGVFVGDRLTRQQRDEITSASSAGWQFENEDLLRYQSDSVSAEKGTVIFDGPINVVLAMIKSTTK